MNFVGNAKTKYPKTHAVSVCGMIFLRLIIQHNCLQEMLDVFHDRSTKRSGTILGTVAETSLTDRVKLVCKGSLKLAQLYSRFGEYLHRTRGKRGFKWVKSN